VFNYNGKLIYSKPLAALNVRARMVELIAELKGMMVKEQETTRTPIKVLGIDSAHRPPIAGSSVPSSQPARSLEAKRCDSLHL